MAFSFIANAVIVGGVNGATTAGIDTTGANLIVLVITYFSSNPPATPTDSKGNTYTGRTAYQGNAGIVRQWFCANPIVGASHTFAISGVTSFASIGALAVSGGAASPADQQSGAGQSGGPFTATQQPGSITPSEDNCLIVITGEWNQDGTGSIGSGSTPAGNNNPTASQTFGSIMNYLIQTTATAINPTMTISGALALNDLAVSQSSYKAAAGGASASRRIYYDMIGG